MISCQSNGGSLIRTGDGIAEGMGMSHFKVTAIIAYPNTHLSGLERRRIVTVSDRCSHLS
jgi:hypothetical protein